MLGSPFSNVFVATTVIQRDTGSVTKTIPDATW
jgi:hypothetical protein